MIRQSSLGAWDILVVAAIASHLLVSSWALAAPTTTRELPPATGALPVGRMTFYWSDQTRDEPATSESDKRELRVDVWYPAAPPPDAPRAAYVPDMRALGKALGAESILLGAIRGHAFDKPEIATGTARYPVVVLSPGFGTNGGQYTALAEELVSHGYVVATIDHPYQSRAIAYPDGRVVTPKPLAEVPEDDREAREKIYSERMALLSGDMRFVLDQLARLDAGSDASPLAHRLDLERVAAVGHSIGGNAASQAALDDARFKAVVNLDGHHMGLATRLDAEGRGPRQPLVELTDGFGKPTDKQLAQWKITREQFDAQMAEGQRRSDAALGSIAGGGYRVTAPGIRHGSFSDMAIWDPDSLEARYRRIQIVRDYTRGFLDKFVRGAENTIYDADSGPYAEVKVERFPPAK